MSEGEQTCPGWGHVASSAGRPEHAAYPGAVRVVRDGALGRAMAARGEHDRVAAAGVEPGGTRTPQLLAGEDRRVVPGGRALGRQGPSDRHDTDHARAGTMPAARNLLLIGR